MPTSVMIAALLQRHRFTCVNEDEVQFAISDLLYDAGVSFEREVALSKGDRIDFMVGAPARLGVEVKTQGTPVSVLRQLHRYAQHETVEALLLVTTQQRHRVLPDRVDGKKLTLVVLAGAFG
jgi:hypothetical protein